MTDQDSYNFAYLDEQTKRMIRRAILKGLAIPGYQVPFASREMPMPYGWGTGGVQVSAAVITPEDTLKVIDQGADDMTNAVSIRRFFEKTAEVDVTEDTAKASLIQTRHRIPEEKLREDQIIVYQVPIPEPLRFLEPSEVETRKMHSLAEYGLMHVKLGDYHVRDIEFVAAFDVNANKVGKDLSEAIYAKPNNTIRFMDVPEVGVNVQRGPTMDGIGRYVADVVPESEAEPVDVAAALRAAKTRSLISALASSSPSGASRIMTSLREPKCCTVAPLKPASLSAWVTGPSSVGFSYPTSTRVPPVKSSPRLKPRRTMDATKSRRTTAEPMAAARRQAM